MAADPAGWGWEENPADERRSPLIFEGMQDRAEFEARAAAEGYETRRRADGHYVYRQAHAMALGWMLARAKGAGE